MTSLLSLDRVETAPSTIAAAISLRAASHPDRAAIFYSGRPPLSFGELERAVHRIGSDLRAAGAGSGSRIGVMLPRGPEAVIVGIAVAAHAICYPLNPALSDSELEFEVARTGLDMLISAEDATPRAVGDTRKIALLRVRSVGPSPCDLRVLSSRDLAVQKGPSSPSAQSVAVIQASSGSTGLPKYILVTHANLVDVANKLRRWFRVGEGDRCACLLPIHSPIGFKVTLLAPLLIGSSVVVTQKDTADEFFDWIGDHDPTWFFAPPPYLNAILDRLRLTGRRPEHSLRFLLSGGTQVPTRVQRELEKILGVPCLEQYGSRESGPITANHAPPGLRKAGTVGPITPDVAVFDDAGLACAQGHAGAVAVRGSGISPGYIEALPAGCDTVPDGRPPDQWMQTGDIGVVDDQGFLSIVGRAKQIINRGGEKIAPAEVEKALLNDQAVREAVVFGIPHPRLGEGVAAAVVTEPGAQVTSAQLQDVLFGQLAPHKIPQRIEIVSSLPRTKAGKVDIATLKDHFAAHDRAALPAKGNLEALIINVWEELLGRTGIGADDNFFDLGGDSLLATTMLLEVETLTKRPVSAAALRATWTVRQIAAVVLHDMPPETEIVTCAKSGTGVPFFFCHGDHRDRGIYAFRLMDLIDHDSSIFLLNHYCDFHEAGDDKLEDIARLYVSQLCAAQPAGRFRLGGYCLGGVLAWEIARQLCEAGREIEFVVMIDSPSLNGHRGPRAMKALLGALSRALPHGLGSRIERAGMWAAWVTIRSRPFGWSAIKKFAQYAAAKWSPAGTARPPRWDEYRRLANYIPARLDTELYCLVCADNVARVDFRAGNWRHLASSVHATTIPGDHHSCVTTFGRVVAAELQDIVRGRTPSPA